MPTAAEKNALYFLAAVALVGGGARAVDGARFARAVGASERTGANDTGSIGERAIASQIAAVDSVRSRKRGAGARRAPKSRPKTDSSFAGREPTIADRVAPPRPPPSVDVNSATAAELERLPRVGPALARRIVAWRDQHGPYRSIEDLRHVRGIGPSTAALLAPMVTF